MDTEISKLKPGAEPADCPVWGTPHGISVKKTGAAASENPCHPNLIPSAFILLQENPSPIPEAGCVQIPNTNKCSFSTLDMLSQPVFPDLSEMQFSGKTKFGKMPENEKEPKQNSYR